MIFLHFHDILFSMQNNVFHFCPDCGSRNVRTAEGGRKWLCPDCGLELFNNVATAVGVVLLNADGQALLVRRAKEPRKGLLAFPGGFCEPDEDAETGAARECAEETGIAAKEFQFIGAFPNTYEYRGIIYKTCDIFFEAKLPEKFELKRQESEVSGFEWRNVGSEEEISSIPLAFESARKALLRRASILPREEL